jgi:hypothetical protein
MPGRGVTTANAIADELFALASEKGSLIRKVVGMITAQWWRPTKLQKQSK